MEYMISIIQYVLSAYKISGKRNDIYKILFSGPTFHRLESDLTGLPDTIGQLTDNSRFSFARIYMQPNITYKTRDINVELSPTTEYLYEKYSHDNGHHQRPHQQHLHQPHPWTGTVIDSLL